MKERYHRSRLEDEVDQVTEVNSVLGSKGSHRSNLVVIVAFSLLDRAS